jgi:hypothetical protein
MILLVAVAIWPRTKPAHPDRAIVERAKTARLAHTPKRPAIAPVVLETISPID